MVAYPVSKAVNSLALNEPRLIVRIEGSERP
jgi:hypothetical protein